MAIIVIGISYRVASLDWREKFWFNPCSIASELNSAVNIKGINESLILSTCNRTEIYCEAKNYDIVLRWFKNRYKVKLENLLPIIYIYQDVDAVRHLLKVSIGLESMVVGETQIINQLKVSYKKAYEAGTIGSGLETMFKYIFDINKTIRPKMKMLTTSIPRVVTSILNHEFSNIAEKTILLIGAGESIKITMRHLLDAGVKRFFFYNRTHEKAELLANSCNGQVIFIDDIVNTCKNVDVVISATNSTEPLIKYKDMISIVNDIYNKLVIIDLAVPRDIDKNINNIKNITLYNIDDVGEYIINTINNETTNYLEQLVDNEIIKYEKTNKIINENSIISSFRKHLGVLAEEEINSSLYEINNGIDPKIALSKLMRRIINKWLHNPTICLKQAEENEDYTFINAINKLFSLSKEEVNNE